MKGELLLICGFGRCGSSLIMQMLAAAGCDVTGRYPAFEEPTIAMDVEQPSLKWNAFAGRAVKWLDPHRFKNRPQLPCRIVWLDRDPDQQARSQVKFLKWMGHDVGKISRADYRRLASSLKHDRPQALRKLAGLTLVRPIAMFRFEDLLVGAHTRDLAALIERPASWVDMQDVVRSRPAECLPRMLEETL